MCLCIKVTVSIRVVASGLFFSFLVLWISLSRVFADDIHSLLPMLDVGAFILMVCSLPSRRRCGGGARTNQNCRAALCRIQWFLWGTEAWDGGEVTSDETSSTPDHLDSLRAMKLQPGRDNTKKKAASRTTEIKCIKVRGNFAAGIRLHAGKSYSFAVGYFSH